MNVNKVKTLTAEIVSAMQHANGAKGDVKKDRSKVADKLRELALVTSETPDAAPAVATLLRAQMVENGISEGTADPYRQSFLGFVRAYTDGVNVAEFTPAKGNGKAKPMAVAEARTYWVRANETPEDKAKREARERTQALIDEIVDRLKVADGDTLREIHETVFSMIAEPTADEAATEAPKETAEQKRIREAREAEAKALAELERIANDEGAQPEQVAREA